MNHKWSKPYKQKGSEYVKCKVCGCEKIKCYKGFIYSRSSITFNYSPACVDDNEEFKGRID
jgi:uncharacterized protein CbrC (UPF0167 family)